MIKKLAIFGLALTGTIASAQHAHFDGELPIETGQSAFAAIAEIVEELRADEKTDWGQVDIGALQEHLVDMDNVTTRSKVIAEEADGAVVFSVTGKGEVITSVQRMTNAHAPMLTNETGWEISVENTPQGSIIYISANEDELIMIKSLGFYGVMTIGAHHQLHHKMIAMGHDPH